MYLDRHHFTYPTVREVRRAAASTGTEVHPTLRRQRDLVRASLLRHPETPKRPA